MNTYERNTDIQEIPLSTPYFRDKVKRFLEANGLRMESLDSYYAFVDGEGELLAGAGLAGSVLKCLAVAPEVRSEGLLVPLVSRIMSEHPRPSFKVFTKPEYQAVFESLGFRLLASGIRILASGCATRALARQLSPDGLTQQQAVEHFQTEAGCGCQSS